MSETIPAPESTRLDIPAERMLFTTEQAAKLLSVGRTTVWELIREGELQTVHIGRSCRISHGELKRYVSTLETRRSVKRMIDTAHEEVHGHPQGER